MDVDRVPPEPEVQVSGNGEVSLDRRPDVALALGGLSLLMIGMSDIVLEGVWFWRLCKHQSAGPVGPSFCDSAARGLWLSSGLVPAYLFCACVGLAACFGGLVLRRKYAANAAARVNWLAALSICTVGFVACGAALVVISAGMREALGSSFNAFLCAHNTHAQEAPGRYGFSQSRPVASSFLFEVYLLLRLVLGLLLSVSGVLAVLLWRGLRGSQRDHPEPRRDRTK